MIKLILITPLNIERVITISVFSANLSPIYQIFPVEFSLKKKKRFLQRMMSSLTPLPPSNRTVYDCLSFPLLLMANT